MSPRIRENGWRLVTVIGSETMPPRDRTTMMRTRMKKITSTRTKNRRSSENPTNSASHVRTLV
jgi:hypothetical protein